MIGTEISFFMYLLVSSDVRINVDSQIL